MNNNNNTRSTDFVRDYLGEPVQVAVASAGPYANLHLAPGT